MTNMKARTVKFRGGAAVPLVDLIRVYHQEGGAAAGRRYGVSASRITQIARSAGAGKNWVRSKSRGKGCRSAATARRVITLSGGVMAAVIGLWAASLAVLRFWP